MSLFVYFIALLLVGLVVGALGRLALPGPDPMSIPQTAAVGVGGSIIAGLIGYLIFGEGGGGILLSVICTAGIVYLIRRSRGGGLMDPGAPPAD